MSTKPDGGPAFPVGSGDMRDPTGLTKREWYAGMALQGMLACPESIGCRRDGENWRQAYARTSFEYADAMLAEAER